jgi:hypothetical protein
LTSWVTVIFQEGLCSMDLVGIAARLQTHFSYCHDSTGFWSGVRVPVGAGNFSLHHSVQTGSEAQPASYSMDNRCSFPGGKAAGREADHSPQSSAEVKNAWSCTFIPQYAFMARCSVKAQGRLYLFTFYHSSWVIVLFIISIRNTWKWAFCFSYLRHMSLKPLSPLNDRAHSSYHLLWILLNIPFVLRGNKAKLKYSNCRFA